MFKFITQYIKISARTIHLFNREIPDHILLPPYVSNHPSKIPDEIIIQSRDQIEAVKFAGEKVRNLFQSLASLIEPGISTQDIDDFVFSYCISNDVYPSPLGYRGFPKSVCTSVNEVVCHGIPDKTQLLRRGDLISVDVSIYTGYAHGDACRSYVVGDRGNCKVQEDTKHADTAQFLCSVAKACCQAGIKVCAPNVPFTAIAKSITRTANQNGCRVVVGVRGHGIGSFLHGPPEIVHSTHERPASSKSTMKPGHIFTVEPCISLSCESLSNPKWSSCQPPAIPLILNDGWTVVTTDRALTAQFEDTILITEEAHSILT